MLNLKPTKIMSIIRYNANDFVPATFGSLIDKFFNESVVKNGGSSFVPKVDVKLEVAIRLVKEADAPMVALLFRVLCRFATRSMEKDPAGTLTVPEAVRFWQLSVPVEKGSTTGRAPIPSGVATARTLGWTPCAGLVVPV